MFRPHDTLAELDAEAARVAATIPWAAALWALTLAAVVLFAFQYGVR